MGDRTKLYLGLDPSLSATGVCVLAENGNVVTLKTVRSKPYGGEITCRFMRYRALIDSIRQVCSMRDVDIVAIEHYSFFSNGRNHSHIIEFGGMLREAMLAFGKPIIEVAPTRLKLYATGKGNAKKNEIMRDVYKHYNVDAQNDNEADAFVLARIAYDFAQSKVDGGVFTSRNEHQEKILQNIL